MNTYDTGKLSNLLLSDGFRLVNSLDQADIILFNTCSVRQHAEERVWGQAGMLKDFKNKRPNLVIGIIGCMAEAQKEEIFRRLPHVDFIAGPAQFERIRKEIIQRTGLNVQRAEKDFLNAGHCAYVKIMEGCDNFCSYCIVPYVRGRETSRPVKEILEEIEKLTKDSHKEITLLGQNVNSYKFKNINFVKLIKQVNKINGLKEFNFITSHPKDTSEELFLAMRDLNKCKKYLHLPVQSGSDRILKLMNRRYKSKDYLKVIKQYRKIIPQGIITTDIIVGFPGETEEDFEKTLNLLKKVEFNSAYIFKYSPRPHTPAEKLTDDVPKAEKERRHKILLDLQEEISRRKKTNDK